jgi:pimeloyl-ACP methyl ester carboxylesterase
MVSYREEIIQVGERKVRLLRGGAGPSLFYLHDSFSSSWLPLHECLAANFEVFVPTHPGFSGSESELDDFEHMEDIIFHYLDLCAALRLERVTLVGASFGGWIAAEWAVRYGRMLQSLVLIDALGLRLSKAPAADILSLNPAALRQAAFADPTSLPALETIPNIPKAEAIESTILARRALARFAWQFPDNPKLRRYLNRIGLPTLILWGAKDAIVPSDHGRAYQEGIQRSELVLLDNVAHLPHVEAPEACARIMADFLRRTVPEPKLSQNTMA